MQEERSKRSFIPAPCGGSGVEAIKPEKKNPALIIIQASKELHDGVSTKMWPW